MENELQPTLIAPVVFQNDKKIVFRSIDEDLEIQTEVALICAIVKKINGMTKALTIAKSIAKRFQQPTQYIKAIIDDLTTLGIIADSRQQFTNLHRLTCNPTNYFQTLTPEKIETLRYQRPNYLNSNALPFINGDPTSTVSVLEPLLTKRHSCRNFATKALNTGSYHHLCRLAYSRTLAPVASAGDFYPLTLYILVIIGTNQMPTGIYQYDEVSGQLVKVNQKITRQEIAFALNDSTLIFNCAGVIFTVADINRHPQKYANRGYRYTLLEAGHVLQTITLAATELGIASVEYGGFWDQECRELLAIDQKSLCPVGAIALGYEQKSREVENAINIDEDQLHQKLTTILVGKDKPLIWTKITTEPQQENAKYHAALASYHQNCSYRGHIHLGGGIASTQKLAIIKAMMEAYERYVCGQIYVDKIAKASDLTTEFLDPNQYFPLSNSQLDQDNLVRFNVNKTWQWVLGETWDKKPIHIPIDVIFYPLTDHEQTNRQLCYHAHSSGCAAHVDLQQAKRNALLELIERDAVMRNWILKTKMPTISTDGLDSYHKRRIQYWQKLGWQIDFVDFSHHGINIVGAYARNNQHAPYLTCGAAANDISYSQTIQKAFGEMEHELIVAKHSKPVFVAPETVTTPLDHGHLYQYSNHNSRLDYLFGESGDIINKHSVHFDLEQLYQPIYAVLKHKLEGIYVVKSFAKELLPINFGFGVDHIFHDSLPTITQTSSIQFPHYFS